MPERPVSHAERSASAAAAIERRGPATLVALSIWNWENSKKAMKIAYPRRCLVDEAQQRGRTRDDEAGDDHRPSCAGPNTTSNPVCAMWPPSSGSTGTRLSRPITGPAHQIAAAASERL